MNARTLTAIGYCASLGFLPLQGQAADDSDRGRFYVGADVGSSRADAHVSQQFFGPETGQPSGDAVGFKVRVGYQFTRHLAAEIGYADFGETDINGIPYNCPIGRQGPCSYDVRSRIQGPLLNVVASMPLGERWSLNARLGGYWAQMKTSEEDRRSPGSHRKYSDDNTAILYGAGLSFRLTPRVEIAADWGQYDQLGLGLTLGGAAGLFSHGMSSLVSLGFAWRF